MPSRAAEDNGPFYGPGSEAWLLNREAMLLLGAGPRALLLQLAHPLVAEGVDQHSNFLRDPWGRLRATLGTYLGIVYGTPRRQRAETERLNRLHENVAGPVLDSLAGLIGGERYSARDPELSLWVHATLIESTITLNEAWIGALTRRRKEDFYAETRPFGRALGIPESILPADLAAFEGYWARTLSPDGPIQITPTARRLALTILHPPVGPIPPALYDWTMWPAVALLPERIRRSYGIAWGPFQEAVAAWLVSGYRRWRPLLPSTVRWTPQALAADRRQAALRNAASGGAPGAAAARRS